MPLTIPIPLTIVLSVGWDPKLLRSRSIFLESEGYVVVSACSIGEAVSLFRQGDFDVVILCYSISDADRNRFTLLIRAFGSRTPIVFICENISHYGAYRHVILEDGPGRLPAGIRQILRKQDCRSDVESRSQESGSCPEGRTLDLQHLLSSELACEFRDGGLDSPCSHNLPRARGLPNTRSDEA